MWTEKVLIYLLKSQKIVSEWLKHANISAAVDDFYHKNLSYPASHIPWEQEQHKARKTIPPTNTRHNWDYGWD